MFLSSFSIAQNIRSSKTEIINPLGAWNCIIYGSPDLGNENYSFSFASDYSVLVSKNEFEEERFWQNISPWIINDKELFFTDSRMARDFRGDLNRSSLGGDWRTSNSVGGWWCTRLDEEVDHSFYNNDDNQKVGSIIPLIPEVMITPAYPRQAHREGLEGSAVICFEVLPNGEIINPEFLELSDEIFRTSSLDTLMSTKFKPWGHLVDLESRPACRSYMYRLDYAY